VGITTVGDFYLNAKDKTIERKQGGSYYK